MAGISSAFLILENVLYRSQTVAELRDHYSRMLTAMCGKQNEQLTHSPTAVVMKSFSIRREKENHSERTNACPGA